MKWFSGVCRIVGMAVAGVVVFGGDAGLEARQWVFPGVEEPVEAEFVSMGNGYVILRGANGKSFELPLANFSEADRMFVSLLGDGTSGEAAAMPRSERVTRRSGYRRVREEAVVGRMISPGAACEYHLTGEGDPLRGSSVNFTHEDGWLFFEKVRPSAVAADFLNRMLVNGRVAEPGANVRVTAHGQGTVVIPQGADFPALRLYDGAGLAGESTELKCHVAYDGGKLGAAGVGARSLVLKRGYMATLASRENGMGVSRNYVAQDHDVVVRDLPEGLAGEVRFVRVFPWRWTSKKGIAGNLHEKLNVGWFYNWNLNRSSTPELEYVPIKQKRHWPGLNQDWRERGAVHLLGFNEPDKKKQANMTVDAAIKAWPELQKTGLRLGSPSTSDGGLDWLYKFVERADREGLRVDFVAVHYYRAVPDPGNGAMAAERMRRFLEQVHERTGRPIWVTEWNNGANWTKDPDPNPKQQKEAVEAMIEMMDKAPFVERYALFNWVEKCRELVSGDGSLTPAGEAYRDWVSPVSFVQP